MFSKLRLTCRVIPSDRRRPVQAAWTDEHAQYSAFEHHPCVLVKDLQNTIHSVPTPSSSSFLGLPTSSFVLPSVSFECALHVTSRATSSSDIPPSLSSEAPSFLLATSSLELSVDSASSSESQTPLSSESQVHSFRKLSSCLSSSNDSHLSIASLSSFPTDVRGLSLSADSSSRLTLSSSFLDSSLSSTFLSPESPESQSSPGSHSSSSASVSSCEASQKVFQAGNSILTSAAWSVTTNTITTTSGNHSPDTFSCTLVSSESFRTVPEFSPGTCLYSSSCAAQSSQQPARTLTVLPTCQDLSTEVQHSTRGRLSPRSIQSVLGGGGAVPPCFSDFTRNVQYRSPRGGALPSPRGDSEDCDAQIDSMSSSDLEHCEDLQSFELAQNLPADLQNFHVCNDGQDAQPKVDELGAAGLGQPSVNGGEQHVMSFREFEQLPPLAEDTGELPAMWEDGGRFSDGSVGCLGDDAFSVGGGRGAMEDHYTQGPWTILSGDSVRIFTDGLVSDHISINSHDVDGTHDDPDSYEQRNTVIEQTLSEIYESPFQQLIYANSQPSPKLQNSSPQRKSLGFKIPDSEDPHQYHHNQQQQQPPSLSRTPNHCVDGNGNEDLVCDNGNENDDECSTEDDEVDDRETVSESKIDTQSTMKASIARAAQRAVSGYRTCRDADSYVGTRVKPTLILARAPPSPSGILRRTNRTKTKVPHGNVRWADGRPPSIPPTDDIS